MEYTSPSQRKKALGKCPLSLLKFFDCELFEPLPIPETGDWLKSVKKEKGQTFDEFKKICKKPKLASFTIFIQPIGYIEPFMLNFLHEYCSIFFLGCPVKILTMVQLENIKAANRISQGSIQYHAGEIIDELKIPKEGYCIIAITMVDLYPRDSWDFVFGLAKGKKGVFSFARFFETGLDCNRAEELRLYRAAKTMMHEVSHMFGLKHCVYYKCLMNGSNSIEESAKKPSSLCCICLHKLFYCLNFDIKERYHRLAFIMNRPYEFFQKQVLEYEKLIKMSV